MASVCHTNLETVIMMIGSALNLEQLEADIAETLKARDRSRIRRQLDKLLIRWLEFRYKYIWKEISRHYRKSAPPCSIAPITTEIAFDHNATSPTVAAVKPLTTVG